MCESLLYFVFQNRNYLRVKLVVVLQDWVYSVLLLYFSVQVALRQRMHVLYLNYWHGKYPLSFRFVLDCVHDAVLYRGAV